ncbi:MAG: hypothetical protein AB7F75_10225 [Planctomycetota bacterium]
MNPKATLLALLMATPACGTEPAPSLPTPIHNTYVPLVEVRPQEAAPSLPDLRTPVTLMVKSRPVSEVVFMVSELLHMPLTFDDEAYAKARKTSMTLVSQGASVACVLNWCARAADMKVHWWTSPPRIHFGDSPPADALGEEAMAIDLTAILEDFNPSAPPREFSFRTDPQKRREAARVMRRTMEEQIKAQQKPNPKLAAALEQDEDLQLMLKEMGESDIKSWAETLSRGSTWTPEELKVMNSRDKREAFETHLKKKFEALDKPLKEFIREEERGLKEVESALKAYDEAGDASFLAFLKSREAEGSRVAELVRTRIGRRLNLRLLSHGAVLTGRARPHEAMLAGELVESLCKPGTPDATHELHHLSQREAKAATKMAVHVSNTLRARWLEEVLYEWAIQSGISLAVASDKLPSRGQLLVNRDNGKLSVIQSLRELATQLDLPQPVEDEPGCVWIGPGTSWRFQDPQPGTVRAYVLPDADLILSKLEVVLEGGPGMVARGPGKLLVVCLPPYRERLLWQVLDSRGHSRH